MVPTSRAGPCVAGGPTLTLSGWSAPDGSAASSSSAGVGAVDSAREGGADPRWVWGVDPRWVVGAVEGCSLVDGPESAGPSPVTPLEYSLPIAFLCARLAVRSRSKLVLAGGSDVGADAGTGGGAGATSASESAITCAASSSSVHPEPSVAFDL